ncbi:DNA-binding protein HEXBP [Bienertia sinuspersici]
MGGQPDMDKLIAEIQKLSAKIDEQEEARKRQETFAATVGDNKLTIGNSKEEASKKPICFTCKGLGHVSKVCPNRTMVTRQEYYNFLMQNMDELVEQEQELVQQALMQDNKLTIGNSKEEASKKPICFKCQGLGHVSKVCPNLLWLLGKNIIIF